MIKVIEIQATKNPKVDRVLFMNADELAIATGAATKMIASKAVFKDKYSLAEGQIITGYSVNKKSFDAPQYEGHKPFETDGKYYSAVVVNTTTGSEL